MNIYLIVAIITCYVRRENMLLLVFALLYTQPIVSSSQMLVDYNWDIYKQHYSGFFGVMFNGFFGIDMVVL